MGYAPVVVFERRKLIARRLLDMGVPVDRITEAARQPGTEALDQLWTREKTIRSLQRLTGHAAGFFALWDTGDLIELEQRCYSNLMGCDGRSLGGLIYSIGGRRPKDRQGRRRQENTAWGIPA